MGGKQQKGENVVFRQVRGAAEGSVFGPIQAGLKGIGLAVILCCCSNSNALEYSFYFYSQHWRQKFLYSTPAYIFLFLWKRFRT